MMIASIVDAMSDPTDAPRDVPVSWTVGINLTPQAEREDPTEGEYVVRMTFDDPDLIRAWAQWLINLDPRWKLKP